MSCATHLTGARVNAHRYPNPPLLDARCPGLRLEALQPHGGAQKCTWTYRYRTRDRRLRQIKLGSYPQMSLSEARRIWDEQKRVRDDSTRGDPRAEVAKQRAARVEAAAAAKVARYDVERLCADYLSEHVDHQRKRSAEPRRLLTREVIPVIGTKVASQLVRGEVYGLVQVIMGRGAERIAQMVLGELKAAYSHAIGAGRLPAAHANPCVGIKLPPAKSRTRAFTEAELRKFLDWLPSAKVSETIRDAMLLELLTTSRQGEIVAMEWGDVDLDRSVWHQRNTKNGIPHDVLLSCQAVELLKGRIGLHHKWVFPRPDKKGPIASKAVGIQQYAAKSTLKIPDWTVHDLRRSALTGLGRMGTPRVVQDRIANHVDSSVSAVYDRHHYDEEARDWLQRWGDHLMPRISQAAANGLPKSAFVTSNLQGVVGMAAL